MTMNSPVSQGHRLNVVFADSTYEALENLAKRKDKNKAAVLRDVISLAKYLEDVREEGGRILVERKDGTTREIVPL